MEGFIYYWDVIYYWPCAQRQQLELLLWRLTAAPMGMPQVKNNPLLICDGCSTLPDGKMQWWGQSLAFPKPVILLSYCLVSWEWICILFPRVVCKLKEILMMHNSQSFRMLFTIAILCSRNKTRYFRETLHKNGIISQKKSSDTKHTNSLIE